MKTRSISAVGIALVSLVPAFIGGWVFAATIAIVFTLAFRELIRLIENLDAFTLWFGMVIISVSCAIATIWPDDRGLPLVVVVMCLVPLTFVILPAQGPVKIADWAVRMGSVVYLALPAYAAVSLRQTQGNGPDWLANSIDTMFGDPKLAEGLGWFLLALLVTWMSDTFAYIVGKTIGRTPLIPRVSPKKTVEGAIGGLVAAGITAMLVVHYSDLGANPFIAFVVGVLLGMLGQLGDLFESQLKRRAGVKDSGSAIPGHGGFLDRIDALIWVLLATFAVVPFLA